MICFLLLLLFASAPALFYTIVMTLRRIKKIYKISAVAILLLALLITGYFVKLGLDEKSKQIPEVQSSQQSSLQSSANDANLLEGYNLLIPKISVTAPIIINVDGNNKDEYNKALENGVAQLKGSALPGRNGNAFVFGHSSYLADKPGNYKEIFKNMNDLNPGDLFEVQSKSARYVYRITNKKVVEPNDVSVAEQNVSIKQMTLMTCWPVGTTKQRMIVVGELVES